jgi:tetratricopeptide (TPR) repeat protein
LQWRALALHLALERWSSAADLLATMVDAPDAPTVLREQYVRALAHLGRYDEMTKQVDKLAPPPAIVSADPLPATLYVSVLLDAAWALRDAGHDAEAQATFRRVLAQQPDQPEAQLAILHLYGTAEERAAQAAAVAARRETTTDPMLLFEEGSDLLGAGDAKGARALLARAAPELAGTDYAEPAWYNLGTADFKLERWEEAASELEKAIAVNPARVESHYKRGIALFHLERCRDAVAALRRTLELQPDKKDAHYYLAGCYTKLGDAAAAARENAIFNAKP